MMERTGDESQQPKCLPAGGQALKRPALADNLTEPSPKAAKNEHVITHDHVSGENIVVKPETFCVNVSSELLGIYATDQTSLLPSALGEFANTGRMQPSAIANYAQDEIVIDLTSDEDSVATPEALGGKADNKDLAIFVDNETNVQPWAQADITNYALDGNANSELLTIFVDVETLRPSAEDGFTSYVLNGKANSQSFTISVDDETNVQPLAQDDVTNNARQQPSTVAKSDQGDNSLDPASDESFLAKQILSGKASGELLSYLLQDRPESLPDLTQTEATDHVDNHPCAAALPLPAIPQPSSSKEFSMAFENSDNDDNTINTDETPLASLVVNRDPFMGDAAESAEDIYKYLLSIEHKHKPIPGFMLKQPEVTLSMRASLVDWLIQAAREYNLNRETLFLTVNYIDRFLSAMAVKRNKLQLLGVAAMFMAAKYGEVYSPDVAQFVHMTDDTYTKKQVLRMERSLLKVLEFDLSPPTINWFCERALTHTKAKAEPCLLCMYLTELVLVDMDNYLQYPNSLVAAAALCLANIILGAEEPWPEHCVQITSYSLEELKPCLREMHRMHQNAETPPLQGIREKYKLFQYQKVALLPSPSVLNI